MESNVRLYVEHTIKALQVLLISVKQSEYWAAQIPRSKRLNILEGNM